MTIKTPDIFLALLGELMNFVLIGCCASLGNYGGIYTKGAAANVDVCLAAALRKRSIITCRLILLLGPEK